MTAHELFAELTNSGLDVTAEGDRLIVRPASRLTDAMRAKLRSAKAELLAVLEGVDGKPTAQVTTEPRRERVGDLDDRVVCTGCRHYRAGYCLNHRRAGLAAPEVGRALAALPQHCPGFKASGCSKVMADRRPLRSGANATSQRNEPT